MSSAAASPEVFKFPVSYHYPPMWTIQRTLATRHQQFKRWSRIILSYCRHHGIWRLSLVDAVNTPLFHNGDIRKSLNLWEAQEIVEWMTRDDGLRRAEWLEGNRERASAWIYWRRPAEWAQVITDWVEATGQKNVVLTLYELTAGDATASQEFHGMPLELLVKSLQVLVKRGNAQVFGTDDQQGVKFF